MCLGIPGKVEEIKGELATVSFGSVRREVDIRLLEDVEVGEYVLVHAGFAINKINQQEAEETLALIREIAVLGEELNENMQINQSQHSPEPEHNTRINSNSEDSTH